MIRLERLVPKRDRLHRNFDQRFRTGHYISRGFQIFGKTIGPMTAGIAGIYIVGGIVLGLANLILPIPLLQQAGSLLLTPILSGLTLIAYVSAIGRHADFDTGLRFGDYFGRLIVLALIDFGIILVATIIAVLVLALFAGGAGLTGAFDDSSMLGLGFFGAFGGVMVAIAVVIQVLRTFMFFSTHFVLFYNMPAWSAVQESFKLAKRHFGGVILLSLFSAAMFVVGVMMCYIGVILTLPIVYAVSYAAFEDLALFEETDDNPDDILEHLLNF